MRKHLKVIEKAQPKTVHFIKGKKHEFIAAISRAQALKNTAHLRIKKHEKKKLPPFNIRTYRKDVFVTDVKGNLVPAQPKPLVVPLMETQSEFVKTILEVRMRHPRPDIN